ncbi:M3 family oligoendopeptidase [Chloroflexota bacterium]
MSTESLPHWDLSNVYPGLESEEYGRATKQFVQLLDDLDNYLTSQGISREGSPPADPLEAVAAIDGYLNRMNAALELGSTLESYVYAYVSTDSYNTTARRLLSELDPQFVRLEQQGMLFKGWIGAVTAGGERLEPLLDQPGAVREHAFHLRETAESSRYLMSAAEETLAAELSLSGSRAWEKLHEALTSQLKVTFELDGQAKDTPITVVQNLRTHSDGAVRQRAYEAELVAWGGMREPLAACLNGVKGTVNTLDRRRGRTDALHEALEQSRTDRQSLDAMLASMRAFFPALRRYWQAKARYLGKEALPWWDLFAPVGESDRRFAWTEARGFVLAQFGTFSERLSACAQRAFDGNWIDAEPRGGKSGGAFCMSLLSVGESRVLANFDGSLDQVLTLAHELGHAYHNECLVGQTPLQRRTPMTLAETASTFCETIVTDAMLDRAQSPDEELAILEAFLANSGQIVVDIYSRYLFETEVFERRAEAELSADDFCEIMLRAQQETYGDGLDPGFLNAYMWAWKPHYYIPSLSFYNFPYAFGLLFSLGLYAIYKERGDAFLADYDSLLASTGQHRAADLAARFGIDIRQPGFWENSLLLIERRIDRYETLVSRPAPP